LPDNTVCRGPDRTARNCVGCYTPKLFPPQSQFEEALLAKYPALRAALRLLPGALSAAARRRLFELYISRKRPAAEAATRARPQALRDAANRTNAIMVPTKLMRDIFIENGINPELLHLVPFGIDTSTLVPFTEKSASQQLRIGYVGSISYHKGVDLLVQAFQSLHAEANAELIIYGDLQQFAEYGAQLQTLAAAKPEVAHKIRFAGTFPNAQFGGVLQNLDVLVVPSRWYENTPLVMQSALATRTPLVVADLGGMSEIVHHETNGLLFAPNDALSLATQLQRLADDRQLLARLRSNIAPERTIAAMVDDIESIYGSARAAAGRDTIGSGSRYAAAAGAAS
jgi:glycosyltransferase involved in cell wall biosynthesis